MSNRNTKYDALVIGGGFFGLYLAEHLASTGRRVVVVEKGEQLMARASWANQARVHNGYHYPRSLLTALRSRVNYPRFSREFADAVDKTVVSVYAVARSLSKVSASQYSIFMERIQSPIRRAPQHIAELFAPSHVEAVFLTEEAVFDAGVLRDIMTTRLQAAGVEVFRRTQVERIDSAAGERVVATLRDDEGLYECDAGLVLTCCYSGTNGHLRKSELPPVPLKYELAEMALVRIPPQMSQYAVTLMCGPFFSCMPFPTAGLHTLSHVRYTPHYHWHEGDCDRGDPDSVLRKSQLATSFPHMQRDAQRYMPLLGSCQYVRSIWEIKAILPRSEVDDSRPILFKSDYGMQNHHVVVGGKIDNVYDVMDNLARRLGDG